MSSRLFASLFGEIACVFNKYAHDLINQPHLYGVKEGMEPYSPGIIADLAFSSDHVPASINAVDTVPSHVTKHATVVSGTPIQAVSPPEAHVGVHHHPVIPYRSNFVDLTDAETVTDFPGTFHNTNPSIPSNLPSRATNHEVKQPCATVPQASPSKVGIQDIKMPPHYAFSTQASTPIDIGNHARVGPADSTVMDNRNSAHVLPAANAPYYSDPIFDDSCEPMQLFHKPASLLKPSPLFLDPKHHFHGDTQANVVAPSFKKRRMCAKSALYRTDAPVFIFELPKPSWDVLGRHDKSYLMKLGPLRMEHIQEIVVAQVLANGQVTTAKHLFLPHYSIKNGDAIDDLAISVPVKYIDIQTGPTF